jgi:PleD family two-component response regulator
MGVGGGCRATFYISPVGRCRLPHRNPADFLISIGEALRATFEATDMTDIASHLAAVTMSVGVASGSIGGITLRKLLSNADTALYRAKTAGRNRVVAHQVRVADLADGLIEPA